MTPPEEAVNWLQKVHVVINNLKTFPTLGTFHGVSHKYMQEYADEFVYRFNRRWWEPQITNATPAGRRRHQAVACCPE